MYTLQSRRCFVLSGYKVLFVKRTDLSCTRNFAGTVLPLYDGMGHLGLIPKNFFTNETFTYNFQGRLKVKIVGGQKRVNVIELAIISGEGGAKRGLCN